MFELLIGWLVGAGSGFLLGGGYLDRVLGIDWLVRRVTKQQKTRIPAPAAAVPDTVRDTADGI